MDVLALVPAERSDPYWVGRFAAAVHEAVREIDTGDPKWARRNLKGVLDEWKRTPLYTPELRRYIP